MSDLGDWTARGVVTVAEVQDSDATLADLGVYELNEGDTVIVCRDAEARRAEATGAASDERRRVAHRLRCWAHIPNGTIGMALMSALRTASPRESADALADLIDPTCEVDMTDSYHTEYEVRTYECRRCGHSFEDVFGAYEYCPQCGCRITNHEEDE